MLTDLTPVRRAPRSDLSLMTNEATKKTESVCMTKKLDLFRKGRKIGFRTTPSKDGNRPCADGKTSEVAVEPHTGNRTVTIITGLPTTNLSSRQTSSTTATSNSIFRRRTLTNRTSIIILTRVRTDLCLTKLTPFPTETAGGTLVASGPNTQTTEAATMTAATMARESSLSSSNGSTIEVNDKNMATTRPITAAIGQVVSTTGARSSRTKVKPTSSGRTRQAKGIIRCKILSPRNTPSSTSMRQHRSKRTHLRSRRQPQYSNLLQALSFRLHNRSRQATALAMEPLRKEGTQPAIPSLARARVQRRQSRRTCGTHLKSRAAPRTPMSNRPSRTSKRIRGHNNNLSRVRSSKPTLTTTVRVASHDHNGHSRASRHPHVSQSLPPVSTEAAVGQSLLLESE